MRRLLLGWVGTNVVIAALLVRGGGDPGTCAHPARRHGGPEWY